MLYEDDNNYEKFSAKMSKIEDALVVFFAKSNQRLDSLEENMQVHEQLRNTQKILWGIIGVCIGFIIAFTVIITAAYA